MKVGIVGFSGCGKSTGFQWLTGSRPDQAKAQFGQIGMAKVPDERLDFLSGLFHPKKTTPAEVAFFDTPGLLATERRDNPRRLGIIRDADGLLIVLDGYSGGDPANELSRFHEEMLFADLEIVTNRIGRLETNLKKPKPGKDRDLDQNELALCQRLVAGFEQGKFAAVLGLKEEEEKAVRSYQLLTLKPELAFLNLGDVGIGQPLPPALAGKAPNAIQAPVKLEMELQELPEDDRQSFMQDLGLAGFSRGEALRNIFAAMGMQVFFTVGEDECRAWPVRQGVEAVEGAGAIHTDLSRGFVRAEVVSYNDFRQCGSLKEAKIKGVYRLEGKTYVVKDGDIMHILSST